MQIVAGLETALQKAFQPHHFNWSYLMSIAAMREQDTHVHWRLHPCYAKPIIVAGETFEDTQWYPAKEKVDHTVNNEILQVIAESIRKNFKNIGTIKTQLAVI